MGWGGRGGEGASCRVTPVAVMNFKHVVKLAEIDHFFLTPLTDRNLPMQMFILGLQPISGDPKDNGVAAMLDDRTFCFVIQHGRHAIVFLYLQGLVANQEYNALLSEITVTGMG